MNREMLTTQDHNEVVPRCHEIIDGSWGNAADRIPRDEPLISRCNLGRDGDVQHNVFRGIDRNMIGQTESHDRPPHASIADDGPVGGIWMRDENIFAINFRQTIDLVVECAPGAIAEYVFDVEPRMRRRVNRNDGKRLEEPRVRRTGAVACRSLFEREVARCREADTLTPMPLAVLSVVRLDTRYFGARSVPGCPDEIFHPVIVNATLRTGADEVTSGRDEEAVEPFC